MGIRNNRVPLQKSKTAWSGYQVSDVCCKLDAAAVYLKSVSKVPDTNKVVVLILVHAIEFCNSYLTLLGLAHRTTVVFEGVQKQFSHLTCTMGILYKSLLAGPKGCPTGF